LAQKSAPAGTGDTFKDTSMLKPPAGAKVAIIELEDLELPQRTLADSRVRATVSLRQRGFSGERVRLTLSDGGKPLGAIG